VPLQAQSCVIEEFFGSIAALLCDASAIALPAREAWRTDSPMCSAVLSTTVCDMVFSLCISPTCISSAELLRCSFADGLFRAADPFLNFAGILFRVA
jgi:hypothetical protein